MAVAKKPRAKKTAVPAAPKTVLEVVDGILDDPRVVWFPVKHFSPVCAWHLGKLIREVKPAGVLVEGPQDATPLIPHIVHADTRAPVTVFSSYVDKDNVYGLNGVLSPSENLPARFRAWWPMTEYAPEYVALKAGAEVGAELQFIDLPLTATIRFHHVPQREDTQVVDDHHLARNAYFEALRVKQRRRSFEEFWNSSFEVSGHAMDTRAFMRSLLTFAYCARHSVPVVDGEAADPELSLRADGTLLREGHMRWCIDTFLKAHPGARIVVVTGAFHSVALPTTKKARARVKSDRNLETLVTPHSFQALATLYSLNRSPGYLQTVWEKIHEDVAEPFNAAALQLVIEVMRRARALKEAVSTADAVGAYQVARNLAVLRRNREATLEDVLDAVRMGYVKGDARLKGAVIEKVTREVMVGHRLGRVTSEAGMAPLVRDYYAQCKAHRIDVTGERKDVRCDLGKHEGHRQKSAFLHQCAFLDVPMFAGLAKASWNDPDATYKGPDLVTGENMHLLGETWGIQWKELVDDRLLELSDRGASMSAAAASRLRELLAGAKGSASETTRLLLRSAQMGLTDMFDELLTAVEDAIVLDNAVGQLAKALRDFVVLHSYRDHLATGGHGRLLETILTLFNKCALLLPTLANASGDGVGDALEALQSVVRITLTFDAVELDRQLLMEKIHEMVGDPDGAPAIRGAGYGVLFSFGATRERVVAKELEAYLRGTRERVLQAGSFLDGLFMSSKNIFMGSPRLLRAINAVLGALDWATFKVLLPDLRRAFTQFIPTEIDHISQRVSEEVGLDAPVPDDLPVPEALAVIAAAADARVEATLQGWT